MMECLILFFSAAQLSRGFWEFRGTWGPWWPLILATLLLIWWGGSFLARVLRPQMGASPAAERGGTRWLHVRGGTCWGKHRGACGCRVVSSTFKGEGVGEWLPHIPSHSSQPPHFATRSPPAHFAFQAQIESFVCPFTSSPGLMPKYTGEFWWRHSYLGGADPPAWHRHEASFRVPLNCSLEREWMVFRRAVAAEQKRWNRCLLNGEDPLA
jgi:hypothetical protein